MRIERLGPRAAPWLLVLVGALVYANSTAGEFVFDDRTAIVENGDIRRLWPPTWAQPRPGPHAATNSRPVVSLSLALNYAAGGLDIAGYRLFNLGVHLSVGLLLYGLSRRTVAGAGGRLFGFCVALLWLVHPLNSQCVNYIIQRSESLSAFFYLLVLYCARRGMDGDGGGWYGAAVGGAVLGMASKEVMATVPVAVLLYDRAFVAGSVAAAWARRRRLYLGLAASWIVLVVLAWSQPHGTSVGFGDEIGVWTYLLNQSQVLLVYMRKVAWPQPLLIDYGRPQALSLGQVWPQAALVLGLLVAALWAAVRRPRVGFAALWFFLLLAPTSSVVPMLGEVGAERRMYLPLMGALALLAWGVALALRRLGLNRAWGGALALAWAAVLAWGTVARNDDYASAVRVWRTAVAAAPDNERAHFHLAYALQERGDGDGALDHYARAIALGAVRPRAHFNRARLLSERGQRAEAEAEYRRVVALERGAEGQETGSPYGNVEYAPVFAAAYYNLATMLAGRGEHGEARGLLRRALALAPEHAEAQYNLGAILAMDGEFAAAAVHFRRALDLKPGFVPAREGLERVQAALGR